MYMYVYAGKQLLIYLAWLGVNLLNLVSCGNCPSFCNFQRFGHEPSKGEIFLQGTDICFNNLFSNSLRTFPNTVTGCFWMKMEQLTALTFVPLFSLFVIARWLFFMNRGHTVHDESLKNKWRWDWISKRSERNQNWLVKQKTDMRY